MNAANNGGRLGSQGWPERPKKCQQLDKDLVCRENLGRAKSRAEGGYALMPLVVTMRQRHPVKRIRKDWSHVERFGVP